MQVCVSSTPAQVCHVLCHQALRRMRRPLVVMSPKSPLRHPLAVSSLEELANGTFLPAVGGIDELDPRDVRRVVMCSGEVYYGLLGQRRKNSQHDVVIMRIGQLYLLPHKVMQEVLQQFAYVKDSVWCQKRSLNQGAWYYSQHHFREVIPLGASLRCIDRPASASPAVGCMPVHQRQRQDLANDVPNIEQIKDTQ